MHKIRLRRLITASAVTVALAGVPAVAVTLPASAATTNTLEDNFWRANQTGWGTSTNTDSATNFSWGTDADGTHAYDTISGDTGQMSFHVAGIPNLASAGSTAYNGGDELTEFNFPATGLAGTYLALNFCADRSCGYEARVNSNNGKIELAKRSGGTTTIETSAAATVTAGKQYWIRFNYDSSAGTLKMRFWANGTQEPSTWNLTWTDTGTRLGAGLAGIGGTWPSSTANTINTSFYAFSAAAATAATPVTLTGAFDSAPANGGNYNVNHLEFGSSAAMGMTNDNRTDFLITNSSINQTGGNGQPGAFPSVGRGCDSGTCSGNAGTDFPMPVSTVKTAGKLKYSDSYTSPANTADVWDEIWDINFYKGPGQTNKVEVELWQDSHGIGPAGTEVAAGVTIGGTVFNVWSGNNGTLITYQFATATHSISGFDMAPIASDLVARGYLANTDNLYNQASGFELWQGGAGAAVSGVKVCSPVGC